MKNDSRENEAKLNRLIQEGQGIEAKRMLLKLTATKVSRDCRLPYARFARRLHLHTLALRLLVPLVRPTGKGRGEASPAEIAEYAASLTFNGAHEEAFKLLSGISPEAVPEALLFMAFARFAEWDYIRPIEFLKRYIALESISEYQRLVGKVNLLSAHLNERELEEADALADDLIASTTDGGFTLLYGNVLEMWAQVAIFQANWHEAEKRLRFAKKSLHDMGTLDQYFAEKWTGIYDLLRTDGKETESLVKAKEAAKECGHWESVRDCDRYLCLATKDKKIFEFLFTGTPYTPFRERLASSFGIAGPTDYLWELKKGKSPIIFNLQMGGIEGKELGLKEGSQTHKLLHSLASDFYRPLRVATIHHFVYPEEFYHPIYSPKKVHELVRSLRIKLAEEKMPLEIQEHEGSYSLKALQPFSMRIGVGAKAVEREEALLQRLRELQRDVDFSIDEAEKSLELSKRTAQRLLGYGVSENVLVRVGAGRATKYRFK